MIISSKKNENQNSRETEGDPKKEPKNSSKDGDKVVIPAKSSKESANQPEKVVKSVKKDEANGNIVTKTFKKAIHFFTSAFDELKKVDWLGPNKTARYSLYVILFLVGGASLIAGLDFLFYRVLELLTS